MLIQAQFVKRDNPGSETTFHLLTSSFNFFLTVASCESWWCQAMHRELEICKWQNIMLKNLPLWCSLWQIAKGPVYCNFAWKRWLGPGPGISNIYPQCWFSPRRLAARWPKDRICVASSLKLRAYAWLEIDGLEKWWTLEQNFKKIYQGHNY